MLKRQSVSAFALVGMLCFSWQITIAQPNGGVVRKKAPAKPRANEIKTKLPHQETPLALPFVMDKVTANQLGKMRLASIRIDKTIDEKLASEGVTPNSPTSDGQFVRRAYLDITGTIPTGREAYLFITSKQSNKRAVLIDYLLGQPG